jgi:hypothetical protein
MCSWPPEPNRERSRLAEMSNLPRGARRSLPIIALFLATTALAACTGSGGPTSPPGSPGNSPSGETGAIGHATGATDVILRAEQAGGFTAPAFQITRVPEFTLYGDGTVLYQLPYDPNDASPIGPPRLAVATLSAEQMDALLAFAINAGGLGGAKAQYINPMVADAPDTIFTIATDDVSKTVSAQALGMAEDPNNPDASNPDAVAIKALKALYDTLVPFGDQVARGNATDAGLYEPPTYRATLQEGQAEGEMIDWPWTDVTLDAFVSNPDSSFRVATLTPEQAKALSPTPEGGLYTVAVVGPDRVPYQISLRPLLPEEVL